MDLRIRARDRDARAALAAGHVRDAGRRIGPQAGVDVWDRGQPLTAEQAVEHRPRESRLAFVEVLPVVGVGNAVARLERSQNGVQRARTGGHEPPDRRDVVEARLVEQRLVVPFREAVAARPRRGGGIVDLEDPARGLLLEPLPDVALVRARRRGELLGGQATLPREGRVETQAITEIDPEDVPSAECGLEEPLDERVAARGGLRAEVGTVRARLLDVPLVDRLRAHSGLLVRRLRGGGAALVECALDRHLFRPSRRPGCRADPTSDPRRNQVTADAVDGPPGSP